MSDATALDGLPTSRLDVLIPTLTFATILLPATIFSGFFLFVLNVIAVACLVVPLMAAAKR